MMDDMLIANEKYLSKFAEKIRELKEKETLIHDEKIRKMCEQGL